MGAIIVWLGNFLSTAIAWFGARYSERIAIVLGLMVVFTGIWATFSAAVWAAITGITLSLPTDLQVFYFLLPDGFSALMTAKVSSDLAAASYSYALENIRIKGRA